MIRRTLSQGEGDYVDLLSVHGLNKPEQLDWVTRPGGCMEVLKEYQRKGKIRFIGFSSHGMTPLIVQAIETGLFDYVNLHYQVRIINSPRNMIMIIIITFINPISQFIGSYTASGSGPKGGNIAAIEAAQKQDMGVFIISPTDKGGALYEPPKTFHKVTINNFSAKF